MGECKLPRDMIIAILARLPVKSLMRFKCVCKPVLIKMHTHLSSHTPRASSVQTHLLDPHRDATLEADHPYDIFLDHCNGLVCMGCPAFTGEVVLLLTSLWKIQGKFWGCADGLTGVRCNAEGDDFMVVRISCFKGKKMKVGVEVYSSKAGSWKTLDDVRLKFRLKYPKNHVIVNGDPYWIACFAERVNEIGETEEAQGLLWFDSTNMKFKVVALPRVDKLGQGPWPFVNWEGSLAVLDCVKKDGNWLQGINVWCYGDGEWKNRSVVTDGLQVDQCLDCSRAGKIVDGCTNGKLFFFDPKTGCVGVCEVKKGRRCSFQIFSYEESLACVKDMAPAPLSNREQKLKFNDIEGFFVSNFRHSKGQIACYYALAS